MAYIVGADRYQTRMVTISLDDLISKDNSVRVIDSYVETLDLENLGFIEYSGRNRGQSPYRRSDLLKLHIYGYLNKIRSSRALETEAKRNLELMWLINCITPDHGTIAGFVQKNKAAFHNTLRNLTLISFVFLDLLIGIVKIILSQNQIQKIVRPIVCDDTALFNNLRVVEHFCILFLFRRYHLQIVFYMKLSVLKSTFSYIHCLCLLKFSPSLMFATNQLL